MWMHWENGDHYGEAKVGVAVSDNVCGPYTYVKTFRPYEDRGVYDGWEQRPGYMSRDSTLFLDDDGKGYFISSSNDNKDMRFYLLTDDFLDVDHIIATHFVGQSRESPAVFKRNGVYFVVTSGTTGWSPNQQKYAWSYSLESGWSWMYNVGDFWGFASQSTYVQPVQSSTGSTSYMYMGDRWAGAWGKGVNDGSGYVWLPIDFPSDTSMEMHWNNTISIDLTRDNPVQGHNKKFRFRNKNSGQYLDVSGASQTDGAAIIQWPFNGGQNQLWDLEYKGQGDFYISSMHSGKKIEVPDWSGVAGTNLAQWTATDGKNQRWNFIDKGTEGFVIWNSYSGKSMQVENGSTTNAAPVEQGDYQDSVASQRWVIETVE
jgi:hypothetical protein